MIINRLFCRVAILTSIFIITATSCYAANNIEELVYTEYDQLQISSHFDRIVDSVVSKYNSETAYLDKVKANEVGIGAKEIAEKMAHEVLEEYMVILDSFVSDLYKDESLSLFIAEAYKEYINEYYDAIRNQVGEQYATIFREIYTGKAGLAALNETVLDEIKNTKKKIAESVKKQTGASQMTPLKMGGLMMASSAAIKVSKKISNRIAGKVIQRVLGKAAIKTGAKAIPFVGAAVTGYSLLTADSFIKGCGETIKEVFHSDSEPLLLAEIASSFSGFNNITVDQQRTMNEIITGYIYGVNALRVLGDEAGLYVENTLFELSEYSFLTLISLAPRLPSDVMSHILSLYDNYTSHDDRVKISTLIQPFNDYYQFYPERLVIENEQLRASPEYYIKSTLLLNTEEAVVDKKVLVDYIQKNQEYIDKLDIHEDYPIFMTLDTVDEKQDFLSLNFEKKRLKLSDIAITGAIWITILLLIYYIFLFIWKTIQRIKKFTSNKIQSAKNMLSRKSSSSESSVDHLNKDDSRAESEIHSPSIFRKIKSKFFMTKTRMVSRFKIKKIIFKRKIKNIAK